MIEAENKNSFGVTSSPSTSRNIKIVALVGNGNVLPVIGKLAYFDSIFDNEKYRAIGTISDIETNNALASQGSMMIATAKGSSNLHNSTDIRTTQLSVQAVFVYRDNEWKQHGSALPNSPATSSPTYLLDEESLDEMLINTSYPSIGFFRGMHQPLPLNLPDFASNRGATHSGIIGRSGSGKTALATYLLSAQMKFENHAIMVIDPQGQWNNENGFLFSPQEFARSVGRPVTTLRVSEDIKLPRDVEVLTSIIDKTNLWARFRRMGSENKEMFSREVAERFAFIKGIDRDSRAILEEIFGDIAESPSTLGRIYTKGERQDGLRDTLLQLAGLDPIPTPEEDEAGIVPQWSAEDLKDTEQTWASILIGFSPIHSLYSSTNFDGGPRRSLGDEKNNKGFLSEILQVRGENPRTPAPYVILDMSPNPTLHAKAELSRDKEIGMQKLLDNQDIKAIILMVVLSELKKSAETAFAVGGGNLNTQIVFDEAWRYAPERSESAEITRLATILEGFALDTRKFGIGWTYILQSPGDLRSGIWKQLTYVYSGYGLVGEDVKRLEGLTDDPRQVDLYRQFISPASTGVYPFMINGPISPLIFTASPTFVNAFSEVEDFIEYNKKWLDAITEKRQMPKITKNSILKQRKTKKDLVGDKEIKKSYGVGKTIPRPDVQTAKPVTPKVEEAHDDKVVTPPPF